MERKTLTITVGQADETLQDALRAAKKATEGEDTEPVYRLNFESLAGVATVTKETNLNLLRAIRQHEPESISELAEIVGRDYREVHRNLSELESLDIIKFEQAGRSKKPIARYDELHFEIPLVEAGDADAAEDGVGA